jgi:hypothetical protein
MRNPPDDAADQAGGRRRGHRGSPSGSHRTGSAASEREATAAGESSVFLPGYDGRREPGPDGHSGGHGRPSPWRGTAATGPGGKGPVRGYPPLPGQPLPMYPPGQFAAWNRGRSRAGGSPDAPGPAGPPGLTGPPAPAGLGPAGGRQPDGSRYYGQETGGYSMLAVSDPAADVTSTQTWEAVGDGRATGTWTSPFAGGEAESPGDRGPDIADDPRRSSGFRTGTGPRLAAAGAAEQSVLGERDSVLRSSAMPPAQDLTGPVTGRRPRPDGLPGADATGPGTGLRQGPAGPAQDTDPGSMPGPAGRGRRLAPWSPQAAATRAAAGATPTSTDLASAGLTSAAEAASAPPRGPRTRQGPAAPAGRAGLGAAGTGAPGTGAPGTGAPGTGGGRRAGRSQGSRAPERTGSRHRYPRSAILIAVVLVLATGGALYFADHLISSHSHQTASSQVTPRASAPPTPTPTPTLGPYGHIASRLGDPVPLTIAQLYPVSFTAGGASYTRTAVRLSKSCGNAVVGSSLQSAIGSAGCSQAVRASYVSGTKMGTIGVFNLKSASGASKAGRAAGASNFVAQLPARSGPTKKLGHGTGVEEAVFKGHYLILIWAEFTDLRTPKTKAQQASLATFMSQLLQSTANVSLSNRMANGSP